MIWVPSNLHRVSLRRIRDPDLDIIVTERNVVEVVHSIVAGDRRRGTAESLAVKCDLNTGGWELVIVKKLAPDSGLGLVRRRNPKSS